MLIQVRKPYGATVVRVTTYPAAMRKHATWRHERTEPAIEELDGIAHRSIQYGSTVRVRKHKG